METSILHHPEASELHDSEYESDLDGSGYELDVLIAHKSHIERLDDSASWSTARQENYLRAREAIGELYGFEQGNSNPGEDPWATFSCGQGFKLGSWFIQSKVPESRINEYFSSGLGSSALVG